MYKHNIEAHSCNHCCHRKARSITYSECVSAFLSLLSSMQSTCSILPCRLWRVWLCHIFFRNGTIFENKSCWTSNMCFDFFYSFCL